MITELKALNDEETLKAHSERWGGYNDFPSGWKDVSEDPDLVDRIMLAQIRCSFQLAECRQMYNRSESGTWGQMMDGTLYFTHGGDNFAVVRHYKVGTGFVFKYFTFGCGHHNKVSKVIGRCHRRSTCSDCGHVWTVDSSD